MTLADWCLEEFSNKYSVPIEWLRSVLDDELSEDCFENNDSYYKINDDDNFMQGGSAHDCQEAVKAVRVQENEALPDMQEEDEGEQKKIN